MSNDEIKKAFIRLASRLSPENLACDGECSANEVRRRRAQIKREWRALEKQAGIGKVSEDDAWEFHRNLFSRRRTR